MAPCSITRLVRHAAATGRRGGPDHRPGAISREGLGGYGRDLAVLGVPGRSWAAHIVQFGTVAVAGDLVPEGVEEAAQTGKGRRPGNGQNGARHRAVPTNEAASRRLYCTWAPSCAGA